LFIKLVASTIVYHNLDQSAGYLMRLTSRELKDAAEEVGFFLTQTQAIIGLRVMKDGAHY
jgi:hypothetical protein